MLLFLLVSLALEAMLSAVNVVVAVSNTRIVSHAVYCVVLRLVILTVPTSSHIELTLRPRIAQVIGKWPWRGLEGRGEKSQDKPSPPTHPTHDTGKELRLTRANVSPCTCVCTQISVLICALFCGASLLHEEVCVCEFV